MPRALWKGAISFGLVTIPVGLVTAEDKGSDVDFHMLDKKTMSRVKQKRVAETSGDEVVWDDIVKGYEYAKDQYVVLEPEEIEAANPKATHTIDIVGVVCGECIDRPFFNKPYYVVPEAAGKKPYALLREVLRKNNQVAVARVVLRTRQYLAALFPEGDALVLDLLRYADELRDPADLDLPASDLAEVGVSEKEVALAEQLISALVEDWDPNQYTDDYRNDLLDLIKRKVEEGGRTITSMPGKEAAPGGEVVDIMDLLKRSLEAAEQEKAGGAEAAKGDEKPSKKRKRA
ncbi:MAG TPA: Ku protein [Coriobacteriia bacterium]|nr:Ku protein [Coriobacteriia bacterium]